MLLNREQLLRHLQAITAGVESGDTLEGSIEFALHLQAPPGELLWEVEAAYRIGNLEGQGGTRIVPERGRVTSGDLTQLPFHNEACATCGVPRDLHKEPDAAPSGSPESTWGDTDTCRTFVRCQPPRAAYGQLP